MLVNSYELIFIFLLIVFSIYYFLSNKNYVTYEEENTYNNQIHKIYFSKFYVKKEKRNQVTIMCIDCDGVILDNLVNDKIGSKEIEECKLLNSLVIKY